MSDEFAKHEVLHTAHIIESMWCDFVLEHPTVAADPELQEEAARIAEAIAGFYQAVGGRKP